MKFNPKNPEPYIYKGSIYIQQGKKEKAIEEWKKAKDLSHDNPKWKAIYNEVIELIAKHFPQEKANEKSVTRYANYLKADFLRSVENVCQKTVFVYKIQDENPLIEEYKHNMGLNYRTSNDGTPLYFSFLYNTNRTLIKKSRKTELFQIDDESSRDLASTLMAENSLSLYQSLHEYYNDDNWLKTDQNIRKLLKDYTKKTGERIDYSDLNNFGLAEFFKKTDWFSSLGL